MYHGEDHGGDHGEDHGEDHGGEHAGARDLTTSLTKCRTDGHGLTSWQERVEELLGPLVLRDEAWLVQQGCQQGCQR